MVKKSTVIGTTFTAVLLLLSVIISASTNSRSTQQPVREVASTEQSNIQQHITTFIGPITESFHTALISQVTHTGVGAYYNEFSTAPENGRNLNIYISNNGTGTVKFDVTRNGEQLETVDVAAGSGKLRSFTELAASAVGLSGDWEVYVYTTDGTAMNLNVNALQY
ncbi:hypothetical protein PCCS19_54490 [Paenibacillus sp. CCS19]|uniref:hypothetical protein n=1 Tax=Paenibacillus sp. CCS19 TaxID=3158387 RepID=UPI002566BAED|nr:hypothetical protein [Paenibacillus cellulosilyticus]GMK42390.1 hypothetical protein PCCS19_54490 [Paenibacillus cellulosilyticus]